MSDKRAVGFVIDDDPSMRGALDNLIAWSTPGLADRSGEGSDTKVVGVGHRGAMASSPVGAYRPRNPPLGDPVPNKPLVAIVDDDESMRRATSNLLESSGFATATFADAEAFLGSRRHPGVSCLVTDMRMPGMTGLELHESLVASGSGISTVLITAYPDETTRLRARKAGVTCFLAKPVPPEELCECVRSALANRLEPKA